MMDIKEVLLECFFFFVKRLGGPVKEAIEWNKQSAKKLHKLIIRKFEKPKLCSSFIDSIW